MVVHAREGRGSRVSSTGGMKMTTPHVGGELAIGMITCDRPGLDLHAAVEAFRPLRLLFAGLVEEPIEGFDVLRHACAIRPTRPAGSTPSPGSSASNPRPICRLDVTGTATHRMRIFDTTHGLALIAPKGMAAQSGENP